MEKVPSKNELSAGELLRNLSEKMSPEERGIIEQETLESARKILGKKDGLGFWPFLMFLILTAASGVFCWSIWLLSGPLGRWGTSGP